nr:hypothetical protein [Tanacetum cinerariifolium]
MYNKLKFLEIDTKGECRAQCGQNSNNYQIYKEAGNDGTDSKAMVVVDGNYHEQKEQLDDCVVDLKAHKHAVKGLEKQIKCHQTNQLAYEEKIRVLSYEIEEKSNILEYRQKLIDQATQEKQDLMTKLDKDGNLKIRPPVTAEEHQQKFEEFKISEEEGLDKGYDKMQKILSQMNTLKINPEPEDVNIKFLRGLPPSWSSIALILKTKGGLEYISFDDLYNKLKFLEINTKGSSSSSSTFSNAAFVSTAGSSQGKLSYQESGNDGYGNYTTTLSASPGSSSSKGSSKSKCSVVDDVIYFFFANHEIDQQLVYEDLDQMNKKEFEEYDLKHQMAMLSIKDKQTEEGNTEPRSLENFGMLVGIKLESDADLEGEVVSADDVIPAAIFVSTGPIAAAAAVSPHSEIEFAFMGLSTELYIPVTCPFDEFEGQPIYNRFASVDHMKAVPSPLTGNYMPPSNIPDIDESHIVYEKKATDSSEIKTNDDSISYSHNSVLFYFSDRSLKPSTNDFQTCDSSQECLRPNHSDHDSNDSISSVSAPASESRDTIVIDCARPEDFPSVCTSSIETDVKSSNTLCNKFRPTGKPVNPNRPKPVSAGRPNPISAGRPNPISDDQPNPVSAGQPNTVSA